jgi:RNA polymerase primary sigma factor
MYQEYENETMTMDRPAKASSHDDPSLDIYLREISRMPVLSEEQELDLAKRAKAGEQKAIDRLAECNLRFVVSVAKEFQGRGLSLVDLINEGNVGLMKAVQRFDASRGYRFNTYAVWWIRQSILKAIAEGTRTIRLPMNRIDQLTRINKAVRRLQNDADNPRQKPSRAQIAKAAKMTIDEVTDLRGYSSNEVSLDRQAVDGEDKSLSEVLEDTATASPEDALKSKTLTRDLKLALAVLTPREEKVLKLYYGLDSDDEGTLDSVGKQLSISRERVRQLKERALKKLRIAQETGKLKAYLS